LRSSLKALLYCTLYLYPAKYETLLQFKKNIWLIYNMFLAMGLVYLVATTYSRWQDIRQRAAVELAYLNRIFASSVTLNFDQQEIMLDLLAQQLTLEITEGIFIDDLQYLIPVLNQIRGLGVKISLDDFVTGYSSLSLLRQLPIDELKIDKSFIDSITTSDEDRLMVLNIIDIAQNLGIQVVAEGIEDKKQSRMLIELDCNLQQGYYFCKPVKLEQLIEYCDQTNWTFDQDDEDDEDG